ncbi:hypothetical protein LJC64_05515 [Ruminococcaceae bacterium OttesenSCG-928-A11]|nr:hypothetical protein [Ruminococcaceae bacterium OttesenSCG-928-A11]
MVKKIISAILAIALAAFCANALCFAYYRFPVVVDRTNAATDWIYEPNEWYINMREGFGWGVIDANGYVNPGHRAETPYMLMLGSSHAEGFQVPQKDRMSSVLGDCFEETLYVNNLGRSGNFFPDILKSFPAAIDEFPNSCAIIITLRKTNYTAESFEDAMNQYYFDEAESAGALVEHLSVKEKVKGFAKESFPYFQVFEQATGECQF